jgi:hypothetical protein
MTDAVVRRVDFGYFVRPAKETGTGAARVEPCLGPPLFLVIAGTFGAARSQPRL